jgi:hypothetical protein
VPQHVAGGAPYQNGRRHARALHGQSGGYFFASRRYFFA